MCARHKAALLRAAGDYLDCEGCSSCRPFRVLVAGSGVRMAFDHEGGELPREAPGAAPPGFRRLSVLESKIVAGLRGKGWISSAELAAAIGEELTSDLRAVIRNLDGILVETSTKLGVRLLPEGGAESVAQSSGTMKSRLDA
jgi:hypothetical protein